MQLLHEMSTFSPIYSRYGKSPIRMPCIKASCFFYGSVAAASSLATALCIRGVHDIRTRIMYSLEMLQKKLKTPTFVENIQDFPLEEVPTPSGGRRLPRWALLGEHEYENQTIGSSWGDGRWHRAPSVPWYFVPSTFRACYMRPQPISMQLLLCIKWGTSHMKDRELSSDHTTWMQ